MSGGISKLAGLKSGPSVIPAAGFLTAAGVNSRTTTFANGLIARHLLQDVTMLQAHYSEEAVWYQAEMQARAVAEFREGPN